MLRRLRRVARLYGSDPRFILASATIANPVELAERLVGTEFQLVDADGAPSAGRRIAIWNPPLIDEQTEPPLGALRGGGAARRPRRRRRADDLLPAGRRGVELIQRSRGCGSRSAASPGWRARIAPYRAGYTPQQRREIEARLARGDLLAVVATNALELGIDIGELDAAICVTFPGTVASLRQMWGRAGRRREGLAIYVAGEDALDQFFCRHPEEFLARPVEAAILDHENERIQTRPPARRRRTRRRSAAPLSRARRRRDPRRALARARRGLVGAGTLRRGRDGRYLPRGPGFPAGEISLRSASLDSVAVVDASSGELLGTVEAERAFSTVHPGAIYLHLGRSYEVRELDVESRRAIVEAFDGDWYTQPRKETMVYIERRERGAGSPEGAGGGRAQLR